VSAAFGAARRAATSLIRRGAFGQRFVIYRHRTAAHRGRLRAGRAEWTIPIDTGDDAMGFELFNQVLQWLIAFLPAVQRLIGRG